MTLKGLLTFDYALLMCSYRCIPRTGLPWCGHRCWPRSIKNSLTHLQADQTCLKIAPPLGDSVGTPASDSGCLHDVDAYADVDAYRWWMPFLGGCPSGCLIRLGCPHRDASLSVGCLTSVGCLYTPGKNTLISPLDLKDHMIISK